LAVFKCGRFFYYDFEFGGRRYHKSTRMTNQRAAEQVESVLKGELVQGRNGLRPYKQPPLFGEYVKTFLKRIEKPLAQNTVDLHNNSLKSLLKLFKNRFLDQITSSMIEDFKAGRAKELKKGSKTQLVSPATVNRELGTLKKILNMAVDDELISINPARKVKPFPEEIPDVHILSFKEELDYLACASEPLKSVAIIMVGQGMRPDEVFRMTYSNLDFFNRTILIERGKTKNAKRTLSMCQEVFELLKERRQKRPNDYWVFPSSRKPGTHLGSVRKAHDRVCDDLGLRGAMDLYNLRHTFATRSILSGTDVTILQKILGHSEIGMTMRYVKIAEHYKVEAVVRLEKYRAVKMQEAVVKMQEEQQEAEKMGMVQ
jgi:integrase